MDELICGCVPWREAWIKHSRINGLKDGLNGGRWVEYVCGMIDRQMGRWMYGWVGGWMDRWVDG